jgi:hypothetical protein
MPVVLPQRVQCVSTTGKTNPCTRSNKQKNISNFLMHRIRQISGRTPVGPGTRPISGVYTQMQILLSACQISKFQNFHNFLKSHQPKGCFLSDRQKSPEFYLLKNVKKKEAYSCILKKKRATAPASTADPKKVIKKKSILIFAIFFAFLAPPARRGSNEYHVHRSEVDIYRVMTRNVSAVFKEESTLRLYIRSYRAVLQRVHVRST